MARINTGILGVTHGRISNVCTSASKGKNVIRIKPVPFNPQSSAQTSHRAKYKLCSDVNQKIGHLLFPDIIQPFIKHLSAWNWWVKNNINIIENPINWAELKYSSGKITNGVPNAFHYYATGNRARYRMSRDLTGDSELDDINYFIWWNVTRNSTAVLGTPRLRRHYTALNNVFLYTEENDLFYGISFYKRFVNSKLSKVSWGAFYERIAVAQ